MNADKGTDDLRAALTKAMPDIAAAMPWYDESDPDYSEAVEVAYAALATSLVRSDHTDALLDIERWSKGFGPTMYNNDEDAGRGTMGRIHRRAREALDATPVRADRPGPRVTTPEGADR